MLLYTEAVPPPPRSVYRTERLFRPNAFLPLYFPLPPDPPPTSPPSSGFSRVASKPFGTEYLQPPRVPTRASSLQRHWACESPAHSHPWRGCGQPPRPVSAVCGAGGSSSALCAPRLPSSPLPQQCASRCGGGLRRAEPFGGGPVGHPPPAALTVDAHRTATGRLTARAATPPLPLPPPATG